MRQTHAVMECNCCFVCVAHKCTLAHTLAHTTTHNVRELLCVVRVFFLVFPPRMFHICIQMQHSCASATNCSRVSLCVRVRACSRKSIPVRSMHALRGTKCQAYAENMRARMRSHWRQCINIVACEEEEFVWRRPPGIIFVHTPIYLRHF